MIYRNLCWFSHSAGCSWIMPCLAGWPTAEQELVSIFVISEFAGSTLDHWISAHISKAVKKSTTRTKLLGIKSPHLSRDFDRLKQVILERRFATFRHVLTSLEPAGGASSVSSHYRCGPMPGAGNRALRYLSGTFQIGTRF